MTNEEVHVCMKYFVEYFDPISGRNFVGRIIVGRNVELPAGEENFQDGYDRSSTGLQG